MKKTKKEPRPIFIQKYIENNSGFMTGTEECPCYVLGWDMGENFESGTNIFCELVTLRAGYYEMPSIEVITKTIGKGKKINLQFYTEEDGAVFIPNVKLMYEKISDGEHLGVLTGDIYKVFFS
jgi:hypothetical protein